jgi:hypothetical protein
MKPLNPSLGWAANVFCSDVGPKKIPGLTCVDGRNKIRALGHAHGGPDPQELARVPSQGRVMTWAKQEENDLKGLFCA